MRRLLRRETFIALRARRQAHQIASEIVNPHLEIPEFQREILPETQDDVRQGCRAPRRVRPTWVVTLECVLLAMIILYLYVYISLLSS
jgi:hypothetical protein